MKPLMLSKKSNNGTILIYCKLYSVLFIIFLLSFLVLAYPAQAFEGIQNGINLCFDRLIAALFPFMIISSFLLKSEAYTALTVIFGNLTEKLFRLPRETFPVILMSFVGGYPIGAIMTNSLFEKKKISHKDAKQLMTFCINPSISFCLSFLGTFLYKSIKTGIIIYLSTVLTSVIIGIIYGALKKDIPCRSYEKQKNKENIYISVAFTEAVSESTSAITAICVTVIIFSCLLSLLNVFTHNPYIHSVFSCILEITNFAQNNYRLASVCVMSASVSFGGLCTHFQIMPYLLKMKISYKHFFIYRIFNMLMSYIISTLLSCFFPSVIPTSKSTFDKAALTNAGIPVSCTLIAMAAIIIITDNAIARIKESGKN